MITLGVILICVGFLLLSIILIIIGFCIGSVQIICNMIKTKFKYKKYIKENNLNPKEDIMKLDYTKPMEYYKKFGCHYCDYRHSCDYEPMEFIGDGPEREECEHFKLGKCFNCSIRLANNGEFVEGVCSDVFDFAGCDNYKA